MRPARWGDCLPPRREGSSLGARGVHGSDRATGDLMGQAGGILVDLKARGGSSSAGCPREGSEAGRGTKVRAVRRVFNGFHVDNGP